MPFYMRTTTPDESNLEASDRTKLQVRYTLVVIQSYYGLDTDEPSHTYSWNPEPILTLEDAVQQAEAKAHELFWPGCQFISYVHGEKQIGHLGEYSVLHKLSKDKNYICICLSAEYDDEGFKEWKE